MLTRCRTVQAKPHRKCLPTADSQLCTSVDRSNMSRLKTLPLNSTTKFNKFPNPFSFVIMSYLDKEINLKQNLKYYYRCGQEWEISNGQLISLPIECGVVVLDPIQLYFTTVLEHWKTTNVRYRKYPSIQYQENKI